MGFASDMIDENGRLKDALRAAKTKLEIYRKHSGGEYHGGMEYWALMEMIDAALATTSPPDHQQ